ncbi:MAG TPA: arginine deiminase family protein [Nannocystaceae bacterium]|nr:arginine deiminase family protein [Nannocystaceae bacterium]
MPGLATPTHAIVRPPAACYAQCLRHDPRPIDVTLAQTQHRGYVAALRDAGITVEILAEIDHPDAVFVEDTAVQLGDRALVTLPGATARHGEIDSIAAVLTRRVAVTRMHEPGRLDGGDVLRCGDTLVVGRSRRTNEAGVAQLAALAREVGLAVVGVEVKDGLHLKSACSLADEHTLLVHAGCLDERALARLELELVVVPEAAGANVLAFGDRVLVSDAAPRTAELLAARGLNPVGLALSEIHAGDGALSCMSLRFAARDAWCV